MNEQLRAAVEAALAHVTELEEAWRIGKIRESDHYTMGATRSNRNIDVRVACEKALAAYAAHKHDWSVDVVRTNGYWEADALKDRLIECRVCGITAAEVKVSHEHEWVIDVSPIAYEAAAIKARLSQCRVCGITAAEVKEKKV